MKLEGIKFQLLSLTLNIYETIIDTKTGRVKSRGAQNIIWY